MNEMNQRVIALLSQIITKLAEGKMIADNYSVKITDHSVKSRYINGEVFIQKGPISRSINLELMEVV